MGDCILSDMTVKARNPHKCLWCGEPIVAGENYRQMGVIYDGCKQTQRYHLECNTAMKAEAAADHGWIEFEPYSFRRGSRMEK